MSTRKILLRRAAAPGACLCAALTLYVAIPYGAVDPQKPGVALNATPPNTAPPASAGEPVKDMLTEAQSALLANQKWDRWVGSEAGIWVSVDEQMLRLVKNGEIVWQTQCATGAAGTGSQMNSYKTPLGWHSIKKKVGAGAPIGQVFRNAQATKEVWKPGQDTKEDLVLTRLMWLTGEEPGKNLGGNVDTYSRGIYIHGTNDEAKIGTPSSHGCVRLRNADAVTLFDLVSEGTPILITETKPAAQ